jgi:prevent-host-death family protein
MRTVAAGEFKAKCLKIMDEVAATGEPVVVTKRGKPIVRMTILQETDAGKAEADSIFGCLQHMLRSTDGLDDLVDPIIPAEEWEHLKEDWEPRQRTES